ncbi:heat shock 70 kDa protein 12A isoform X1 [Manis pentadactyla]|uniref:heat shock 70 kDa protein 12A isoform X1 n=1 Tax=Manis pentadactyla TaxID=143292 RepID=UPI00255C56B0|nr:heat shock 70 kDa protein 12A isoform X1 [Manis pentadactyla]
MEGAGLHGNSGPRGVLASRAGWRPTPSAASRARPPCSSESAAESWTPHPGLHLCTGPWLLLGPWEREINWCGLERASLREWGVVRGAHRKTSVPRHSKERKPSGAGAPETQPPPLAERRTPHAPASGRLASAEPRQRCPRRGRLRGTPGRGGRPGRRGALPPGPTPRLPASPSQRGSAGRGRARGGPGRSTGRSPGCGGGGGVRAVLPLPGGSDPVRVPPQTPKGTCTGTGAAPGAPLAGRGCATMADKEAGGGDTGPREPAPTSAYSSPARSLGDTGITPLSPSHIVNDADTNVSEQQMFLVVVAIDFGTTSSGYAYSFTKEPECIHVMRRWEGGDPGVSNQKTPTTILLTPERKFHSFGYAARDFYHDLDPTEAKQWLYLEKFKMKLHVTGDLTMETDLTAANGKKVKALEIFAYALQYFKEQALKELSDQAGSEFENSDVRWVITVPAIWKQPAKQFMRQAAYQAGLASPENSEQLIIALEPEAASIYCRKLRLHQMIELSSKSAVNGYSSSDTVGAGFAQAKEHVRRNRQSRTFLVENVIGEIWSELEEGDKYVVVDSGGGTVDLTVHQIRLPEGHLKELYKATGGPYGSLGVDYEFEKLLCKIFGEDFIEQFKIKRPAAWVDLMIAFESRKRAAAPDRTNPLNITLPFSFIDYYKKFRGHSVEHALRKSNVDFVKWSSQGMLRMSPDAMNALFKPTIDSIIEHLRDLFQKPEVSAVKFLFLVGGFAEAPLLQQAVQAAFGNMCRIIIPQDVGLTILKGAVLFGLDPAVIKVRRSPLTYGVGVLNRYVEGRHPPEKLLVKDGTRWCTDVFDKFISADQSVALGELVKRSYTPAKPSQLVIVINIYSSEHDNVSFITDPGVKKCGTLRLDLTGTSGTAVPARREIQTLMQFGDTEIKAMAIDIATSKSVKVGIDFLNY